jgi:hypothetical protein
MKKLTVLLALALMVFVLAPAANATAGLRICDNLGNCLEARDDGSPLQVTGTATGVMIAQPGSVTIVGSVGVFVVNVDSGLTKPIYGSPQAPKMDLLFDTVSVASGTLTIQWSDVSPPGFTYIPGYARAHAGGTISGDVGTLIQYTNSFDSVTPAVLYSPGVQLTSQQFGPYASDDTFAFAGDASGGAITTAPYALMQQLIYTANGATQSSGDFHLDVVPEPASVLLLGGALLLTVRAIRRRARQA